MVVSALFFAFLFLVALVGAYPSLVQSDFSRRSLSGTYVTTPIGIAQGTAPINGTSRFAVKYAYAERWQNAEVAEIWELPNGSSDPTSLPLACPQSILKPSQYSENCLSMLLYVPSPATASTNLPVFLWIHGGSFIQGSATAPGLDGTHLAQATSAIVVVVQYRLGALGFNSPDGGTNFAVRDIITSLHFLRKVLPSFGGDPSKITVAGQSSGANLIRALLATPSAAPLFQSAILHSDPMDFGFLSTSVQRKLQAYFNEQIACSSTDTWCINSLSLSDILSASDMLFNNGATVDPSAQAEPMRPVHDDTLIQSTLDSTTPFPPVSKTLILSNVLNEAGPTVYGSFIEPMSTSLYSEVAQAWLRDPRASNVLASPYYQVPVPAYGQTVDARVELEKLGTDWVWRCPTWTFARSWVNHGGKVFVSLYSLGATYSDNEGIPFCTETGSVCHEDDIEIVFGTVINPTSAQSSLITEVQARYKSFLRSGDPNPAGNSFPVWSPATTGNFSAHDLGSSETIAIGACDPEFWGTTAVPYDYQIFGI